MAKILIQLAPKPQAVPLLEVMPTVQVKLTEKPQVLLFLEEG